MMSDYDSLVFYNKMKRIYTSSDMSVTAIPYMTYIMLFQI